MLHASCFMLQCIVGLGNPTDKLKRTRHNVGFMLVDFLAEKLGCETFSYEKKFEAEVCKANQDLQDLKDGQDKQEKIVSCDSDSEKSQITNHKFKKNSQFPIHASQFLLAKPQTYMNSSGRAVRKMVDFYTLKPERDLILAHDDLDIEFGSYKIQYGKGPRVHNGVQSVIKSIGTEMFWRIRIGIAGETLPYIKKAGKSVADEYVLKNFSQNERSRLDSVFETVYDEIQIQ